MPSIHIAHHVCGKRTLQRLRREAGYRSAKDFAAVLGIPASTYASYERQPEGPGCAIPLSSAWQIADALGCSIDLVVGRADIDIVDAPTIDEREVGLSLSARETLAAFMDFLEQCDAARCSPMQSPKASGLAMFKKGR